MRQTWLFRRYGQMQCGSPLYRPFIEILEDRTLLSFITAPTYATGDNPQSVAVGDFNSDGIPDLAVADGGPAQHRYGIALLRALGY